MSRIMLSIILLVFSTLTMAACESANTSYGAKGSVDYLCDFGSSVYATPEDVSVRNSSLVIETSSPVRTHLCLSDGEEDAVWKKDPFSDSYECRKKYEGNFSVD